MGVRGECDGDFGVAAMGLITLARFRDPWEAHMLRGRLEAESVRAWVAFEYHVGNNWLVSNALGGVRVQVSADDAERARDVAENCTGGKYHAMLRDRLGEIDDRQCPNCGSTDLRRGWPTPLVLAVFILAFPLGSVPAWRWNWSCQRCGTAL